MKSNIHTIEELQGIAKSELSVIFRKAAEVACDAKREPRERAATKATMENIRRRLNVPKGP